MSSKAVQAADAIVALIGTPSGYKAVRAWTVIRDPDEFVKTGWVTVIPATRSWPDRRSRVGFDRTFEIQVGVQNRITIVQGNFAPNDQVDAVDQLADTIGELLMNPASKVIGAGFKATCQSLDGTVLADHEQLKQNGIATSLMVVRYKVDP